MAYIGQTPSAVPLDGSDIADDIVDSQHYAAGSIDTAHIADVNVTTGKIANDAITLAKMAAGTDGNIISYDASGNPVAIATGSDGQVLTSAGAGAPPAFETAAGGGVVVQVVNVMDGAVATGTDVIIDDDTIPQNSEGDQYMSLAITPTNSSNKLLIHVIEHGAHSATGSPLFMHLSQDSTAGSLALGSTTYRSGANPGSNSLVHFMSAGTTSATTFKVFIGGTSGTYTHNGSSSGRKGGGVMASSITIWEIAV